MSTQDPIERELLEKVYAAPHDDGPRLVYADWLLEHELPRGELIMLQYKRAQHGLALEEQAREEVLLKKHAQEWLGELASVVDPKEMMFRRGFLSACNAWMKPETPEALLDASAWSTVERIGGDVGLIAHRALKGLRAAGPLSPTDLSELLEKKTPLPALEELRIEGPHSGAGLDQRLVKTAMFPGLLRLAFIYPDVYTGTRSLPPTLLTDHYQTLLRSPLGQQLDGFAVNNPHFFRDPNHDFPPLGPMLVAWLHVLEQHPSLKRLCVVPTRGLAFKLLRAAAGISLVVEWHSNFASAHPATIARALVSPEVQALASVRVEQHGVQRPHHRSLIETMLSPLPRASFRHHSQSGPDLSGINPSEDPTLS